MRRSETRSSPPYAPLLQMAYGALSTQILCVAAQLGLPDRLAQDGPISASELAPKIGVDALTVERVLRALVSMDVCTEIDGSRFRLTSLGEYLRPNHPDSVPGLMSRWTSFCLSTAAKPVATCVAISSASFFQPA